MSETDTNPKVDRYLTDDAMDHIDHALGRPANPLAPTYRNYFAIDEDAPLAAQFRASPHWKLYGFAGDMAYFSVTEAGKEALVAHLASIRDPWRLYEVTFRGFTTIVSAKSVGNAKYRKYLDIADCLGDTKFGSFAKNASVRLAQNVGGARHV